MGIVKNMRIEEEEEASPRAQDRAQRQPACSPEAVKQMHAECRKLAGLTEGPDVARIERAAMLDLGKSELHVPYICCTALWLFDQLQGRHGLRDPRWRYLLWAGALLHDVGRSGKVEDDMSKIRPGVGFPLKHAWIGAAYILHENLALNAGNLSSGEIAALVALHAAEEKQSHPRAVEVGHKLATTIGPLYRPVYENLGNRLPEEILRLAAILRVADGLHNKANVKANPFCTNCHRIEGNSLWIVPGEGNNNKARDKEGLMRALFGVGVLPAA